MIFFFKSRIFETMVNLFAAGTQFVKIINVWKSWKYGFLDRIRTEYRSLLSKSQYSVEIRENTVNKKLRI